MEKNLDALSGCFATELDSFKMNNTDYAKSYTVSLNSEKTLESFSFELTASDMEIGLLGAKIINKNKNE